MPIDTKIRKVYSFPPYSQYKPPRIPINNLPKTTITLEEYEAIRLVDYENLDQRVAAQSMSISQSTFNRILKSARNKIASVLVNGHVLELEGGNNVLPCRLFKCRSCSFQWTTEEQGYPKGCPTCSSEDISRVHD